jgi:hypothetical protein
MRVYPQPFWNGGPLESGRLLLWHEQGVGDEIMFAGLIPELLRAGHRCVVDCDLRLKPLFSRSFPEVEVVSGFEVNETGFAAHLPLGSLPRLFRPQLSAFTAATSPYLVPDLEKKGQFRTRYFAGKRVIGLAWYTNNKDTGRSRSIELSLFAPLFALRDISWVSLQYGDQAVRAPVMVDRSVDQLSDLDGFAAQIAAMDLVITIDNSTAHLAGALGVPVWLLLPFAADWRWFRERGNSPWYPSMRIFRQQTLGDWTPVVESLRRIL